MRQPGLHALQLAAGRAGGTRHQRRHTWEAWCEGATVDFRFG